MAKSYIVNGEHFRTQTALKKRIRGILHAYPPNAYLNPLDFVFMLDLLKRHPRATQKAGCGVRTMYVKPDNYGTRCFWLVRNDETETDFSYIKCLREPKSKEDFSSACRNAIRPTIKKFRDSFFKAGLNICELSGQTINRGNCHVDHKKPWTFTEIVSAFVDALNLDISTVELKGRVDGSQKLEIKDRQLRQRFVVFHNQRAELRVVHKTAHLRLKRK